MPTQGFQLDQDLWIVPPVSKCIVPSSVTLVLLPVLYPLLYVIQEHFLHRQPYVIMN